MLWKYNIVPPHFNESIAFCRIWAPLLALNFNCAPLFASVTARSRITSPRADCVYAFARTSHAAASASTIGAVPGALFDVLAVLVEGGSADAAQLPAR